MLMMIAVLLVLQRNILYDNNTRVCVFIFIVFTDTYEFVLSNVRFH